MPSPSCSWSSTGACPAPWSSPAALRRTASRSPSTVGCCRRRPPRPRRPASASTPGSPTPPSWTTPYCHGSVTCSRGPTPCRWRTSSASGTCSSPLACCSRPGPARGGWHVARCGPKPRAARWTTPLLRRRPRAGRERKGPAEAIDDLAHSAAATCWLRSTRARPGNAHGWTGSGERTSARPAAEPGRELADLVVQDRQCDVAPATLGRGLVHLERPLEVEQLKGASPVVHRPVERRQGGRAPGERLRDRLRVRPPHSGRARTSLGVTVHLGRLDGPLGPLIPPKRSVACGYGAARSARVVDLFERNVHGQARQQGRDHHRCLSLI